MKWLLYLYKDEDKKDLFKVLTFESIKDMSYVIDIQSRIIHNYYHKLIKPRGVLKFCEILRI